MHSESELLKEATSEEETVLERSALQAEAWALTGEDRVGTQSLVNSKYESMESNNQLELCTVFEGDDLGYGMAFRLLEREKLSGAASRPLDEATVERRLRLIAIELAGMSSDQRNETIQRFRTVLAERGVALEATITSQRAGNENHLGGSRFDRTQVSLEVRNQRSNGPIPGGARIRASGRD